MRFKTFTGSATALALIITAAAGNATTPPPNAATMRANLQEVTRFKLTESFLRRDLAFTEDAAAHPCQHAGKTGFMLLRGLKEGTLDQAIAQFDSDPDVHAMLAKHGLTAREALLGGLVMMMTGLNHLGHSSQGKRMGMTSSGGYSTPNMRANQAFYDAHWPQIHTSQQKIGAIVKQQMDDKGSKEYACRQKQIHEWLSPGRH